MTRRGEEPPRHTRLTEDELFYVLEGTITFGCGNQTFDLESGGFVFPPRGLEHGYTIHSNHPVRLLVVTAPVREGSLRGGGGFIADLESGQGDWLAKPPAA